ncbi:MAG TPA: esterase-like activity of phytase family protein [Kofleriaceae bacterium]|nr:esterase-like activity of phytase family protein [Kofleriaceae bacterium]
MFPDRELLAALLIACHASSPAGPAKQPKPRPEVLSCVDLPRDDPRSHDLSGLAWDPAAHVLYALSDRVPRIVVLAPRPDFEGYEFRSSIPLELPVERWDGEALALADDRFLVVADETRQAVFSVDRQGRDAERISLPWFRGTRHNLGLEGVGYVRSPEGRYVFAINEEALEGDGPTATATHGTVVRLLRHPLDGGDDLEVAYLTDPIFADGAPGDNGVSDIAALSRDRVLVLERAYVVGKGNAIRIYDVDLRSGHDIRTPDASAAVPIPKQLVVDLALIKDHRCADQPQLQRRRTLENYEGMAIGPTLDDGRRVLFLVSDDNSRATQTARVLALAIAAERL